MAKPEGYRKAQRLYNLANKFNLPVVTFVDTPGAHPGVDAEDRGQSEAIANSIRCSINVKSPIFSFIIGEGGSGGAVALATGNKVVMLEHAIYSVISPEGCASILWRSANESEKAAHSLKLTAQDLLELGIIDEIIQEPVGGAHRNVKTTCQSIKEKLIEYTNEFQGKSSESIILQREQKYLSIGKEFLSKLVYHFTTTIFIFLSSGWTSCISRYFFIPEFSKHSFSIFLGISLLFSGTSVLISTKLTIFETFCLTCFIIFSNIKNASCLYSFNGSFCPYALKIFLVLNDQEIKDDPSSFCLELEEELIFVHI